MAFTEKNIKYADLIVPFSGCPLGEAVEDCPFTNYLKIENPSERIRPIDDLPEEKLDKLRAFHRKCLQVKIDRAQEESTRKYQNMEE
jgi:hypothetical protein